MINIQNVEGKSPEQVCSKSCDLVMVSIAVVENNTEQHSNYTHVVYLPPYVLQPFPSWPACTLVLTFCLLFSPFALLAWVATCTPIFAIATQALYLAIALIQSLTLSLSLFHYVGLLFIFVSASLPPVINVVTSTRSRCPLCLGSMTALCTQHT